MLNCIAQVTGDFDYFFNFIFGMLCSYIGRIFLVYTIMLFMCIYPSYDYYCFFFFVHGIWCTFFR